MQVIIDGIKYAPAPPECADAGPLDVRLMAGDFNREMTLREYFQELLLALWCDGESFSGKRPFGNSGWEFQVYAFLIKAGVVKGSLDEDGLVEDFDDHDAADKLIPGLIAQAFGTSTADGEGA